MANASKAAATKATATANAETEADLRKRANVLAATAIKLSLESEVALKDAFASATMLAMRFGDCSVLNKLFVGAANKDSQALRAFALPKMHDLFARAVLNGNEAEYAGVVEIDAESDKWTKRPPALIRFTAKPKDANGKSTENHFTMVRLNEKGDAKPAYEGKELAFAKAMKARIIADGEDALKFEWVSALQAASSPEIWNEANVGKKMIKLLTDIAKKAPGTKTRQEMQKTAVAFGLSATETTAILEAYDNASHATVKAVQEATANDDDDAKAEDKAA